MKAIAICLAVCLAGVSSALDKTITESYVKIQAATVKKDIAKLRDIWKAYADPSCTANLSGRKVTYDQMFQMMDQQLRLVKRFNNLSIKIASSKQKGDTVVCLVQTKQSCVMNLAGKESLVEGTSLVEDTWKKIKGTYKIVAIRTVKEDFKQDGKPVGGK